MKSMKITLALFGMLVGVGNASPTPLSAGHQYVLSLVPNYQIKRGSCPHVVSGWALCNYSDDESTNTVILHHVNGAWKGVAKYGGHLEASDLEKMYGIPASVAQVLAK